MSEHGGRPMTLRECMEAEEPTTNDSGTPRLSERLRALTAYVPLEERAVRAGLLEAAEALSAQSAALQAAEKERDDYKTWWERDSAALGKVLGQLSNERTYKEDFRALAATKEAALQVAREALDKAADTFADAKRAFALFGKFDAARAMEIAEMHTRTALADAAQAESKEGET